MRGSVSSRGSPVLAWVLRPVLAWVLAWVLRPVLAWVLAWVLARLVRPVRGWACLLRGRAPGRALYQGCVYW